MENTKSNVDQTNNGTNDARKFNSIDYQSNNTTSNFPVDHQPIDNSPYFPVDHQSYNTTSYFPDIKDPNKIIPAFPGLKEPIKIYKLDVFIPPVLLNDNINNYYYKIAYIGDSYERNDF